MSSSGSSRALWNPQVPAKGFWTGMEGGEAPLYGAMRKARPSPFKERPAGAEPAGPEVSFSGTLAGPIATAAFGPAAAGVAMSAAAAAAAAEDLSPVRISAPIRDILKETASPTDDAAAAAAVGAYREDKALLQLQGTLYGQGPRTPSPAATAAASPVMLGAYVPGVGASSPHAAARMQNIYGTDEYRGYKTVGVADVEESGATAATAAAAATEGEGEGVQQTPQRDWGTGAAGRGASAWTMQEEDAPLGGTQAAAATTVPTRPLAAAAAVESEISGAVSYNQHVPLLQPSLPPTASTTMSPARFSGSRHVTFAEQQQLRPRATPSLGTRRGSPHLMSPAGRAWLGLLLIAAAVGAGGWTFVDMRHRELVRWAVLSCLITTLAASGGIFLIITAFTDSAGVNEVDNPSSIFGPVAHNKDNDNNGGGNEENNTFSGANGGIGGDGGGAEAGDNGHDRGRGNRKGAGGGRGRGRGLPGLFNDDPHNCPLLPLDV